MLHAHIAFRLALAPAFAAVALAAAGAAFARADGDAPRVSAAATHDPVVESAPRITGTLSLADAMRFAARYSPSLASPAWRLRAAEAQRRDVGRPPNPGLELSAENLGGGIGGEFAEYTAGVSQTVELGGDRAARAAVAGGMAGLAARELDAVQRAVLGAAAGAFLEAWRAQERLARLRAAERLAEEAVGAAEERVRVGASPPLERVRAQGDLATRTAERRRAEAELSDARRALALQWGAGEAGFDSLALDPPVALDLPAPERLLARLREHPEWTRAAAEVALEEARVRVAHAARLPDLEARVGARRLEEAGGTGVAAGVAIQLPLWSAGRGALAAARAERAAAAARERAARLGLEQALRSAHDRLRAAWDVYGSVRDQARPAAEEALALLRSGYRSGRFGYLDLLQGQRATVEAELLAIEATRDVWGARLALERLLGAPLDTVGTGEER